MKPWIAVVALAAFMVGCVGQNGGSGAPDSVGGAGSSAPSDEEARRAYGAYRYRLTCGDREDCGVLWRQQPYVAGVSQAECDPPRRSGEQRCTFGVHEWTDPYTMHMLLCRGVFRRDGDEWTMLSVL